jgi:uncharacterized protein (DUF1800 family)
MKREGLNMSSPLTAEQKTIHFLDRTSFGVTPEIVQRVNRMGMSAYLDEQLQTEKISDDLVEEKVSALKTIRLNSGELFDLYPPPKVAKERGMAADMMKAPRMIIYELQQARLLRAVQSQRQLNELMVDFWNNHFNIFAAKGADRWLTTSYDRDTIRPHALGKFRDLLLATAKSPAMLFYLDNWLSVSPSARMPANARRRGLNENYGRELMELHTLGVDGGYTQQDVREVARCFTGWTLLRPRGDAEFRFEPRLHDPGDKIVLGRRITAGGIEDGVQVIDLLARHPSTARLEFAASALRITGADVRVTPQLIRYLGRMGEPLFLAQPPTGYPDVGSSWISPDMLLTRMNFAADLVGNRLEGARVAPAALSDTQALIRLVAPDSLSPTTRRALAETDEKEAPAILLAAPEFQRR